MPRELINASISHVSYVDRGANLKKFFFTKSDEQPDFKKEVDLFINKEDEEKQLVYGVVYEPGSADDESTHDSHGDFMKAEEIEKAAHQFMTDARNIDKQHDFEAGAGEVVESYIAPTDMTVGEHEIAKGSWVLVTKATDEIWQDIKKGNITGYSMAGTAETIEKEQKEKPVSKSEDDEEYKGFFNLLKNFFTKGEVRDRYESSRKDRNVWGAWDALESVFYEAVFENETVDVADFEKLEAAANDFLDLVKEIKTDNDIEETMIQKREHIRKDDEKVTEERLGEILDEKLKPIKDRLNAIEEEIEIEEDIEKSEESSDVNAQVEMLKSAIEEAVTPINNRLEKIEKARGISKQADVDNQKDEQVQKSVWDGLL